MRIGFAILIILYNLKAPAQAPENPLELAANQKNNVLFDRYFEAWANGTNAVTDAELAKLNDTLQQVYKVFTAFYDPIRKNAHRSWVNYRNSKYLAIQDRLAVFISTQPFYKYLSDKRYQLKTHHEYLCGTLELNYSDKGKKWMYGSGCDDKDTINISDKFFDTIFSFRPAVKSGNKQVLYIDAIHERQLREYVNCFAPILAYKYGPDAVDIGQLNKQINARKKHMDQYLKIWYGQGEHFQKRYMYYNWTIPSLPEITSITFDEKLQNARVEFITIGAAGISILKREGDNWKELLYYNPYY